MKSSAPKLKYALLVVAGSAGSLDVLMRMISAIVQTTIAVIIVVHRKDDHGNVLVGLMSSRTTLKVKEAEDKEMISPGTIYIAAPDYHLLIEKNGSFSLDSSDRINFSRPSIDATFETAAEAYGSKMIAVLLSGANNDGAAGLKIIADMGGTTIIQDPSSAEVPYMPQAALNIMKPAHIITTAALPDFIHDIL